MELFELQVYKFRYSYMGETLLFKVAEYKIIDKITFFILLSHQKTLQSFYNLKFY
jgi:hypothetical protein